MRAPEMTGAGEDAGARGGQREDRRSGATARRRWAVAVAVTVATRMTAGTATIGDAAFVVDDLGVVRGTITTRQCQPAPAARTAPKEAGRDQVRV